MFKKWHLYPGFDVYSGNVWHATRKVSAKRIASAGARTRKVNILQRAVKGRVRKLLTAGIAPQALHNAQVVGATDTEVEKIRRIKGEMLNIPKRDSTTAALLTMPGQVDPLYRATIPLVKNWLQILWGLEIPLSRINKIFAKYRSLPKGIGGWRRGKLPWAALELTLNRVRWEVRSPTLWMDHHGRIWNLLDTAPRDVIECVQDAITQHLLNRVQTHGGYSQKHLWWEPVRVLLHTTEAALWGEKRRKNKKSKNERKPNLEIVEEEQLVGGKSEKGENWIIN